MKIDPRFIDGAMATDAELDQEKQERQAAIEQAVTQAVSSLQVQIDSLEVGIDLTVLNQEIVDRIAGDQAIQALLDQEISDRQALEQSLQNLISQEIASILSQLSSISTQLADEISNRISEDTQIQNNLTQEITDRQNADILLQQNITNEQTAREASDASLQSQLDLENSQRQSQDVVLQQNIDAEASTRQSSDDILQSSIDTESLARQTADNTLQNNITIEEVARQASDSVLQQNIDTEASERQSADIILQNNIDQKVAKAGDTMSGDLDLNHNNVLNVNNLESKLFVTTPTFTTVSNNGSLNLNQTTSSVHFLTGNAAGYSVIFPDATTIPLGTNFEIYNRTSGAVMLKHYDGSMIGILSTESVSSLILQDNSTQKGDYSPFTVEVAQAAGISNYNASSTATFVTTTTNTYQQITDFVVTPSPGKYAVWFDCSSIATNNNSENYVAIYKDDTIVADSERYTQSVSSNFKFKLNTLAIVDFNGVEQLRVYVKTSTGTLTIGARTGVALRLGPTS